jgi:hypothetical protein
MGSLRRLREPLMIMAMVLLAITTATGLWLNRGSLPAWQPATAKIMAIVPSEHRFHPNDQTIVVRNAHGTGQFTLHYPIRCNVGDTVAVEQAGITLRASPATCR